MSSDLAISGCVPFLGSGPAISGCVPIPGSEPAISGCVPILGFGTDCCDEGVEKTKDTPEEVDDEDYDPIWYAFGTPNGRLIRSGTISSFPGLYWMLLVHCTVSQ